MKYHCYVPAGTIPQALALYKLLLQLDEMRILGPFLGPQGQKVRLTRFSSDGDGKITGHDTINSGVKVVVEERMHPS